MILGDTAQAVRKHSDDEDKGGGDLPPPGGKQKIIIINEQSVFFDSFQWISAQDFNGDISEIELNEEVFDSNAIAVKEFVNDRFGEIRCVMIDGEPWFVGKDVATILGYAKPLNVLATHIDKDDFLKRGLIGSDVANVLQYTNPAKAIIDRVDDEDRGGEHFVRPWMKAKEGQGTDLTSVENSTKVRTDEVVAEKLGIGSKDQYRRESAKTIRLNRMTSDAYRQNR